MIELYNERTGEYRNIEATTIQQDYNPDVFEDPYNSRFVYPAQIKTVLFDDHGNEIGDVLVDDSENPRLLIDNEVWWVTSVDTKFGKFHFKQPITEEYTNKEWLDLLEE